MVLLVSEARHYAERQRRIMSEVVSMLEGLDRPEERESRERSESQVNS
jgi:hypothetical protein